MTLIEFALNQSQTIMANTFKCGLAPERWDRLRQVLRQHRVVRVEDLCRELRASPATVRRDLAHLEKLGEVKRVHGGAVCIDSSLGEPVFEAKASISTEEKRRIARAALEYIEPGDTIYLDGGSTVLELARLLRDRTNIIVVTNSLRAASELAGQGPRLILIGGELRRISQTLVGPLTRWVLQELHLDKAFMGTMGLSLEAGLTTTDPSEAFTKELVMGQVRRVILLADSTKAGRVSFARAGRLENVHVLITDKQLDKALARQLAKKGIEVVRV
ncbi:MAG: DeoR/GlpR family DNA-binding transcription regulator [Verrucomicrobiales bacterium]|nr:DeoR/GlpR family DNA-binding transcription regulator [Verrucomicrobiales bacterium]